MSFDHVMETACAWTIMLQTQELKVVQEKELYCYDSKLKG